MAVTTPLGGSLATTFNSRSVISLPWKDMLSNAVLLNWNELMPESAAGQVQIEYHVGPTGNVEFLKVWGATVRGHWNLICSYWMQSGSSKQSAGLQYPGGHKPDTFRGLLDSIMQRQELFRVETSPGSDGMIQVSPPSQEEHTSALKMMDAWRDRSTS